MHGPTSRPIHPPPSTTSPVGPVYGPAPSHWISETIRIDGPHEASPAIASTSPAPLPPTPLHVATAKPDLLSYQVEYRPHLPADTDTLIGEAGKLFAQLETRLADLMRREESLHKQLAAFEQERRLYRLQVSQAQQKPARLHTPGDTEIDLGQLDAQFQNFASSSPLQAEFSRLREEFQLSLDKDRDDFQHDLQEERLAHEEQLASERLAFEQVKKREIERLRERKAELDEEQRQFHQAVVSVQSQLDDQQKTLASSQSDLEERQRLLDNQASHIAEYEALIDSLTNRLQSLEAAAHSHDELLHQLETTQAQLAELRADWEHEKSERDQLLTEYEHLEHQLTLSQIRTSAAETQAQALEAERTQVATRSVASPDPEFVASQAAQIAAYHSAKALQQTIATSLITHEKPDPITDEQTKLLERRFAFQQKHLDKQRLQLEQANQRFLIDYQHARTQLQQDRELLELRTSQLNARLSQLNSREDLLDHQFAHVREAVRQCHFLAELLNSAQDEQTQKDLEQQMLLINSFSAELEARRERLDELREELSGLHRVVIDRQVHVDQAHRTLIEKFGDDEVEAELATQEKQTLEQSARAFLGEQFASLKAEQERARSAWTQVSQQEARLTSLAGQVGSLLDELSKRAHEQIASHKTLEQQSLRPLEKLLRDKLEAEELIRELSRRAA